MTLMKFSKPVLMPLTEMVFITDMDIMDTMEITVIMGTKVIMDITAIHSHLIKKAKGN